MQVNDKVRTVNGTSGVVLRIEGAFVEVMFPTGTETIHRDDLLAIAGSPIEELLAGQTGEPIPYALRLQALYLRHAYRYDERAGLSNARVEPNLHQVFIAHTVCNKVQPRMILADEVGLGKTIEAGLILKELRARGVIDRVIVICPASLQYQWQAELRSKFNEEFEILNAAAAKYLGQNKANPFTRRDNIICSIPFASAPKRAEQIIEAGWDLVIFDEAHRVRRWRQSPSNVRVTQAYRLADELKEQAEGFLLLTATPMQLHPFELYSLIELVEPGLYSSFEAYDQRRADLPKLNQLMRLLRTWLTLSDDEKRAAIADYRPALSAALGAEPASVELDHDDTRSAAMDNLVQMHPLAGVMVRNRKAELGGFAQREAFRVPVNLSNEEIALYHDITSYLQHGYNQAVATKQNAVGFLMVTYQKMLASSSYSIFKSLQKRVAKLKSQLAGKQLKPTKVSGADLEVLRDGEELSDVFEVIDDWIIDVKGLEAEIAELELLIARLTNTHDSKTEELVAALARIYAQHPEEKIVIFTQFVETMNHLIQTLRLEGYRVAGFSGKLKPEEKEEAIREFRNRAQILVCTEAGGEGRNLQFAHIIVNYDLPWNPMKVEQRIGRLDRIGQKKTVFIYNLACVGTLEERVLDVLERRINLFTESVGSLDPILGELEEKFETLVMTQTDRFAEEFEDLEVDIDKKVRQAKENERVLGDLLLDRASLRRDEANALLGTDPLASPKDLRQFISDMVTYYGGTLMPHSEGGEAVTLSPRLATQLQLPSRPVRGSFDPHDALVMEDLDFLAMGHGLVDAAIEHPTAKDPVRTARRTVPGLPPGEWLELWYEIRAEGAFPQGRVLRHVVGPDGQVNAEVVKEMPPLGSPSEAGPVPGWVEDAAVASRRAAQDFQGELREEVRAQADERIGAQVERAQRIFTYRRDRLSRRIVAERQWIAEKETSGSDNDRKILPARRGRLASWEREAEELDTKHHLQLEEIKARRAEVRATLWAAGLVVGG